MFDFSNNPGLFRYLLDRAGHSVLPRQHGDPAGTQADLIRAAERRTAEAGRLLERPFLGLPSWDGIANAVRHYDVSEYMLDHYRPLLYSHGYVFMARNGRTPSLRLRSPSSRKAGDEGALFQGTPVDWGYAPNFLSTRPGDRESPTRWSSLPADARCHRGHRLGHRPRSDEAALEVVAAIGSFVIGHTTPSSEHPGRIARYTPESALPSGPASRCFFLGGQFQLEVVRFYALTRSQNGQRAHLRAHLRARPDHTDTARGSRFAGRSFRAVPGGIHGWAEATIAEKRTCELELRQGATHAITTGWRSRTRTGS